MMGIEPRAFWMPGRHTTDWAPATAPKERVVKCSIGESKLNLISTNGRWTKKKKKKAQIHWWRDIYKMAYYTAIKNYILKKILWTLGKFSNYRLKCKHRPQNPYSMYSQLWICKYVWKMSLEGKLIPEICASSTACECGQHSLVSFAGLKLNST